MQAGRTVPPVHAGISRPGYFLGAHYDGVICGDCVGDVTMRDMFPWDAPSLSARFVEVDAAGDAIASSDLSSMRRDAFGLVRQALWFELTDGRRFCLSWEPERKPLPEVTLEPAEAAEWPF